MTPFLRLRRLALPALGLLSLALGGCVAYPANTYHSSLDSYCCDVNGYVVYRNGYSSAYYPYYGYYGPYYGPYYGDNHGGHHHDRPRRPPVRPPERDDRQDWSGGWPGHREPTPLAKPPARRNPRDPGRVSQSEERPRRGGWAQGAGNAFVPGRPAETRPTAAQAPPAAQPEATEPPPRQRRQAPRQDPKRPRNDGAHRLLKDR